MDSLIVILYCAVVITVFTVFGIVMCGCGSSKKTNASNREEGANQPEAGGMSAATAEGGSFLNGVEFPASYPKNETPDKRNNVQISFVGRPSGSSIVGIPKLPPKGEEVDVPLPKAAKSKIFKKGPRPKRVPKAGHTCPVAPADEDPTMPVEDDMLAYKMAAKNSPAAPIPPVSKPSGTCPKHM